MKNIYFLEKLRYYVRGRKWAFDKEYILLTNIYEKGQIINNFNIAVISHISLPLYHQSSLFTVNSVLCISIMFQVPLYVLTCWRINKNTG